MKTRPEPGDSSRERAAMLPVRARDRKALVPGGESGESGIVLTPGTDKLRLQSHSPVSPPGTSAFPTFPTRHHHLMKRILISLFVLAMAVAAQSAEWVAGRHYVVIPTQRTMVPAGKVEVLEVFSYGCPACYSYQATMSRIKAGIPKNAQVAYLPASWHAEENWPIYQRAYLTAQALGVADKAHDAMFEAVWRT